MLIRTKGLLLLHSWKPAGVQPGFSQVRLLPWPGAPRSTVSWALMSKPASHVSPEGVGAAVGVDEELVEELLDEELDDEGAEEVVVVDSQASPMPLALTSAWVGLATAGQLSSASATPSRSLSAGPAPPPGASTTVTVTSSVSV